VATPGTGTASSPITGTTGDLNPGITGSPGAAGTVGATQPGVVAPQPGTVQPGVNAPMLPADITMAQQIRARLLMGTGGGQLGGIPPQSLSGVQMSVNNGLVTLRGTVGSEAERQLLETRIRNMTGVRSVVNGLTVANPAATGSPAAGATGTGTGAGTSTTPLPGGPR